MLQLLLYAPISEQCVTCVCLCRHVCFISDQNEAKGFIAAALAQFLEPEFEIAQLGLDFIRH